MAVIQKREATGPKKPKGRADGRLMLSARGSYNLRPLSQVLSDVLKEVVRRVGLSRKEARQMAKGELPKDKVMRRLHVRMWNDKKLVLQEKTRRNEITPEEGAELKVVSALLEAEPIMDMFSYRVDSRELGKWDRLSEEQRINIAFVYLSQVYNYGGREGRSAASMALRAHPEFREIYREYGLADEDIDSFMRLR